MIWTAIPTMKSSERKLPQIAAVRSSIANHKIELSQSTINGIERIVIASGNSAQSYHKR
jgi:hypothetical protein